MKTKGKNIKHEEWTFLAESNLIENEPDEGEAMEDAIAAWEYVKGVDEITVDDVLKVHSIIMRSRNTIDESSKGAFTRYQTGIYGDGILIRLNPEPDEMPELLDRWIGFMNDSVNELESDASIEKKEKLAIDLHVEYEKCHFFEDGNGRTGRLWYNWHRLKYGLPIHLIRSDEKADYYGWFR